ncbi:MAG: DoxX family protein [Rhodospirillaceae bacterium]|jgi:putative oxidoreductase|nr:DoxX family protein [Rhodospirillaceae bacterium]MBT5457923.1 DoxX family protein [Rhodospirillaceae bacterium]
MFEGQSLFHIAGQLLLAFLFIATGILNAATKFQQHLDRMIAAGVPLARPALIAGFAFQLTGGAMLALDYRTDVAAAMLIVFTVAATAIFHRYWQIEDPLRRHLALSFVFNNVGIVGGLLLVT